MPRPPAPRIPPLRIDQRDEQATDLLSTVGPYAENHLFTTMVRHPRLFKRWVPFGTAMLFARLPARDRELLILRTASRCDSAYEWEQHEAIAADAGVSEQEVAAIQEGTAIQAEGGMDGWDPFDAALIRAVDEMIDEHLISDATWATLAERYDDSLLIEVTMVVSHYFALGLTLNSLGVEPEQSPA